jgi:hypothetical protein
VLLDGQFDEDLERSERVEQGDWEDRALVQRLGEAIVRPAHRWF